MTLFDKFQQAEEELSREHGRFSLFGLFERRNLIGRWDVVMSAPWLGTDYAARKWMVENLQWRFTDEEWLKLAGVVPLNPVGEFVTDIGLLYPMEHGLKHIPSIVLSGLEINRGVIITANPEAARVAEPAADLAAIPA